MTWVQPGTGQTITVQAYDARPGYDLASGLGAKNAPFPLEPPRRPAPELGHRAPTCGPRSRSLLARDRDPNDRILTRDRPAAPEARERYGDDGGVGTNRRRALACH